MTAAAVLASAEDASTQIARAASGWRAELALRYERRGDRTVLATRRQSGPLTVQRPFYPEGDAVCHTYLIHPPAGIVGGDQLEMSFELVPGTHGLITTPSATRWYFSRGIDARLRQHATVGSEAVLEWLPQETLVFDGAHARIETRIDLDESARFCGWEILGSGRPASGELFTNGRIDFRFDIHRGGRPLLLERLRGAAGLPGMRGNTACATLVATPAGADALELARDVLGSAADVIGASTRIGDVLIGRGLAAHCEPLVQTFRSLWAGMRPLLLGRVAAPPRIWNT